MFREGGQRADHNKKTVTVVGMLREGGHRGQITIFCNTARDEVNIGKFDDMHRAIHTYDTPLRRKKVPPKKQTQKHTHPTRTINRSTTKHLQTKRGQYVQI